MLLLYLLVEGQTEFVVADQVLQPHFEALGIHVRMSILATKRRAGGPAMRGGVSSWSRVSAEIGRILRDRTIDVLTTLVDYYGMPSDTPGMGTRPTGGTPCAQVRHVENEMEKVVGDPRFVANLVLHEIETWVLAAAAELGELVGDVRLAAHLAKIVSGRGGPELVDDGPTTAPSKRIHAEYPAFDKTLDGPLAIADLGLVRLRELCPHANAWLSRIECLTRDLGR